MTFSVAVLPLSFRTNEPMPLSGTDLLIDGVEGARRPPRAVAWTWPLRADRTALSEGWASPNVRPSQGRGYDLWRFWIANPSANREIAWVFLSSPAGECVPAHAH